MASRSLGTLTLDLVAKTGGYVAGLDKAERSTDKWKKTVSRSFSDVSKKLALVGASAAAGIAAITISTINSAKEIKNFAAVANTSAKDFQRISLAADKYGISQEKVADILKDTSDKVGDFLQTGAGPLADFFENIAPLVGVTADQFRGLSGPDALGLYVSSLEKANLSQSEMTFFMEAIASDATLLLPLLKDNGKELKTLADRAEAFGAVLSDIEIAQLNEVKKGTDDIKLAFKGLSNEVAIGALPLIKELSELLSDERTIEGAKAFANAIATSMAAATKVILGTTNAVVFLSESLAANVAGPAIDDIVRLDDRVTQLKSTIATLKPLALSRPGDRSIAEQLEGAQKALEKYSQMLTFANEAAARNALVPTTVDPKTGATGTTTETPRTVPVSPAATRFIEDMKLQVALLGKTNTEIELYKLKLGKASPAQLAMAESLLRTVDALEKQTEASKKSAEEITKINGEALAIHDSLRTEEEAIEESYARRREIVLNNTKITGEAQKELLSRLAADRESQLENTTVNREQQAKLEALERDISAISDAMRTEEQVINDSYQRRKESILNYIQETGTAQTELLKSIEEDRQAQLDELEGKRRLVSLQNYELLFNGISSLAREFAGEQSALYKVAFAIEKAAAIARAIIAIQTGIALASEAPFPANIAAMASVVSATAGIVSTIRGTNIEGQAHDGLDSVPRTGTYLLEKGERVTTEKTSAKLDRTLDRVQERAADKNSVSIGQMVFPGVKNERDARLAGGAAARKINQVLTKSSRYA